jgi:hypothetical protein
MKHRLGDSDQWQQRVLMYGGFLVTVRFAVLPCIFSKSVVFTVVFTVVFIPHVTVTTFGSAEYSICMSNF